MRWADQTSVGLHGLMSSTNANLLLTLSLSHPCPSLAPERVLARFVASSGMNAPKRFPPIPLAVDGRFMDIGRPRCSPPLAPTRARQSLSPGWTGRSGSHSPRPSKRNLGGVTPVA